MLERMQKYLAIGSALALVCISRCCLAADKPEAKSYPSFVVGNIPQKVIFGMKEHTYALYYWMDAYLGNKIPGNLTLVHVDAHGDDKCGCLNTPLKAKSLLGEFRRIPSLFRRKKFQQLVRSEDSTLGEETFMIPAMYMDIIDSVIWIRPNPHYFVKESLFRKEPFFYYLLTGHQVKDFDYCNRTGDCEYVFGCEMSSFEIEKLPALSGPVLLDIDMDTFGDQYMGRFCSLSYTPQEIKALTDELVKLLASWAPRVYLVTISDSAAHYATAAALSEKAYLKTRLTQEIQVPGQ